MSFSTSTHGHCSAGVQRVGVGPMCSWPVQHVWAEGGCSEDQSSCELVFLELQLFSSQLSPLKWLGLLSLEKSPWKSLSTFQYLKGLEFLFYDFVALGTYRQHLKDGIFCFLPIGPDLFSRLILGDFNHSFDSFRVVLTLSQSQADKYHSLVSCATYFSLSKYLYDYVMSNIFN